MASDEEQGEDVKQEVKPENHLNIKVRDTENGEVHFKVRSSTKFQKVFEAFCQRRGLEVNSVRFLFDGERLRADQSPDDYDMEDGDCIDAMMEQIGGN